MKTAFKLAALVCFCLLMTERPAHAYLDPGSGSMILQVLLGGIAGAAVVIKMYWRRFLAFFGGGGGDDRGVEGTSET